MPPNAATGLVNSGNLCHLTLGVDDALDLDPAILDDISTTFPGLHSFTLYSVSTHTTGLTSLPHIIDNNSLIWRLPHLRSLDISVGHTITRSILVSLSEISLQSLTLGYFSTSITPQSPRLHFPALRHLSLTAVASSVVDILQAISFPNATGLFLRMDIFDDTRSAPVHRTTFNIIYSTFPTSLRRVYIEIISSKWGQVEESWLGPDAINFDDFVQPLKSLRGLRELKLNVRLTRHVRGFLELHDADLRSLIPSWPELVLFEYTVPTYWHAPTSLPQDDPTLDTIFAFARAHPHLLHLELSYMRVPGGPDDLPSQENTPPPLEGHGLLWFKVGWPADGAGKGVPLEPAVQALDRAFPQVGKTLRRDRPIARGLNRMRAYLEAELFNLHAGEGVPGA